MSRPRHGPPPSWVAHECRCGRVKYHARTTEFAAPYRCRACSSAGRTTKRPPTADDEGIAFEHVSWCRSRGMTPHEVGAQIGVAVYNWAGAVTAVAIANGEMRRGRK